MKQIIQDLKNGDTILEEVPAPGVKSGQVLIQTTKSLVSLGTERMLVEFGKANFIQKARQQPDKVKEVLNKIKKLKHNILATSKPKSRRDSNNNTPLSEERKIPHKQRIRELIKKPKEKFLTSNQEKYWKIFGDNQIT